MSACKIEQQVGTQLGLVVGEPATGWSEFAKICNRLFHLRRKSSPTDQSRNCNRLLDNSAKLIHQRIGSTNSAIIWKLPKTTDSQSVKSWLSASDKSRVAGTTAVVQDACIIPHRAGWQWSKYKSSENTNSEFSWLLMLDNISKLILQPANWFQINVCLLKYAMKCHEIFVQILSDI